MLNKIIEKRRIITIICLALYAITFILSLIFWNNPEKISIHIVGIIVPAIIYGFVKIMFKIMRSVAKPEMLTPIIWLLLIGGAAGTVMMILHFITAFPNGFSPSLGAAAAELIAILAEAEKNMKSKEDGNV